MKLSTYRHKDGTAWLAAVLPDNNLLIDLALAAPDERAFSSMLALMQAGSLALDKAREVAESRSSEAGLALDSVALMAP